MSVVLIAAGHPSHRRTLFVAYIGISPADGTFRRQLAVCRTSRPIDCFNPETQYRRSPPLVYCLWTRILPTRRLDCIYNMPSTSPSQPADGEGTKRFRRFKPEPVETSAKSNRSSKLEPPRPSTSPTGVTTSPTLRPKRRFAPQLIETTQRSRKSGDTVPALLPTDKTNISPGDLVHLPRHLRIAKNIPIPPVNTPTNTSEVPVLLDSRFSSASLQKQKPRQHSFRVPDLASITSQGDSEESGDSKVPSLSTSSSSASDETDLYKHATRIRESCDDTTSGYLLALAARAAEKQLKEQAMAAYPNEHAHEPVDHFAFDRDSESSGEEVRPQNEEMWHKVATRRESAARWNMDERRRHREGLDRPYEGGKGKKHPHVASTKVVGIGKHKARDTHEHIQLAAPEEIIGGHQKCNEVAPMRKAASPPMLGDGIVFPKSESPQPTMLMVGSYPRSYKGVKKPEQECIEGLWTAGGSVHGSASTAGLWNGVCNGPGDKPLPLHNSIQTGLLTPSDERDDPMAQPHVKDSRHLPPSPPSSQANEENVGIDYLLNLERQIDEEYHDSFVTQVYNYVSLGYPSLARRYDEELSKITRVSVESLRRDDLRKNTKGYVGAPEGSGSDVQGVENGECARWSALRLYIREWARQQARAGSHRAISHKDWGAAARKGSWAF